MSLADSKNPKMLSFSVWDTDMSQIMRLSSVWPIDCQYHSQAAGYSCKFFSMLRMILTAFYSLPVHVIGA